MRIAVIGSNGKSGRLIVDEALARGLDVLAVSRGTNTTAAPKHLRADVTDLTAENLAGVDVIVSALGFWAPDTLDQHTSSALALADLAAVIGARLIVVGGAGSLWLDEAHTQTLMQSPGFPPEYRGVAQAMADQLDALRGRDDTAWTVISPPADFRADGERTGAYVLAGEEFTTNEAEESVGSYADFAIAVVDEAVATGDAAHIRQRISVRQ